MESTATQTIAFMDSGIGGLAALRETMLVRPLDRYVYLADDLAFPFSTTNTATLTRHVRAALELFGALAADLLVLPTGDLAALVGEHLAHNSMPFRVIDPCRAGLAAAITNSVKNRVGIICGSTCDLPRYYSVTAQEQSPSAQVVISPSAHIASIVQQSSEPTDELVEAVRAAVLPFTTSEVDSVLIDSSHAVMVDDLIRRSLGPSVSVVTSSTIISNGFTPCVTAPDTAVTDLQLFTTDARRSETLRIRANQYLQMPVSEPTCIGIAS